jgi:hypothetical protein
MESHAIISECGQYRYYLSRRWKEGGKVMIFIMLNPSTADASVDDATIRKCVGFANRAGCNAIEVVNLFGFRATKPADLWKARDPVGPDNMKHIRETIATPDAIIVCAWGANASHEDAAEVMALLRHKRRQPYRLAMTNGGQPGHPLMLPYSSTLEKM